MIDFIRTAFWYLVPHRCVAGEVWVFQPSDRPDRFCRLAWCRRCSGLMKESGYFGTYEEATGLLAPTVGASGPNDGFR